MLFVAFNVTLHIMTLHTLDNITWKENVILADADYIDKVAFDLTVNFERIIGRAIPRADMAKWIDCIALDGGLRKGDNETQVILTHSKGKKGMDYFVPATFNSELDGKAFSDTLGEFLFSCVTAENLATEEELFIDIMQILGNSADVKRLMIIPDIEQSYDLVRQGLRHATPDKHITMFSMQPLSGGSFRQEILGYSLMAALGISSDEIRC